MNFLFVLIGIVVLVGLLIWLTIKQDSKLTTEERKKQHSSYSAANLKKEKENTELRKVPPILSFLGRMFVMIFAIFYLIIALFIFIWWIIGTVGFIMSLICFGYSGPMSDKFLGLIMAWVTGPFYWLYYIYNSNYCTRHVYYQQ